MLLLRIILFLFLFLTVTSYAQGYAQVTNFSILNNKHNNSSNQQPTALIAIDMDHDKNINQNSILKGDDGIFIYNARIDCRRPFITDLSYFSSFDALSSLDTHNDGLLELHDDKRKHLYLLFFRNYGKTYDLVYWTKTGVRGIFLSPKHILSSNNPGPWPSPWLRGMYESVRMASNTKRKIVLIRFPLQVIVNANMRRFVVSDLCIPISLQVSIR